MLQTKFSVRRLSAHLALSLAALLLFAPNTHAGVIGGFVGNTQPSHPGGNGVDGTVLAVVYDTSGGSAGNPWGAWTGAAPAFAPGIFSTTGGSGALDLTAQYLYVFETVNNGTNALAISQNTVFVNTLPGAITSWGSFQSPTGGTTKLDPAPSSPAAGFGDISPFAVAGVAPQIISAATIPTSGTGGGVGVILNLAAQSLGARYDANGGLLDGQVGTVWGFTSNIKPVLGLTSLQDGGTAGDGLVPTNLVPEIDPGSAVSALTILGLGVSLFKGRRRKA